MTENNGRGRLKNVMSEKNQGLQKKGGRQWKKALFSWVVIKTMLLPIKYKLFLVFKLSGLNNFLLANKDLLKLVSAIFYQVFIFFT